MASARTTGTGVQSGGSRGGRAHAATQSEAAFETLIGPLSSAERKNVVPSNISPQTSRTPHPSAQSSSQPRQGFVAATSSDLPPQANLDFLRQSHDARKELLPLPEAVFPDWRHDASSSDLDRPEEMQKRDPLATQIWKLYSKTKTELPNHERMENLTWRMMAMNLKRKEREQARYAVNGLLTVWHCARS